MRSWQNIQNPAGFVAALIFGHERRPFLIGMGYLGLRRLRENP